MEPEKWPLWIRLTHCIGEGVKLSDLQKVMQNGAFRSAGKLKGSDIGIMFLI